VAPSVTHGSRPDTGFPVAASTKTPGVASWTPHQAIDLFLQLGVGDRPLTGDDGRSACAAAVGVGVQELAGHVEPRRILELRQGEDLFRAQARGREPVGEGDDARHGRYPNGSQVLTRLGSIR
jgi:hypothetical protein